jgi:hypothetical protein
VCWKYFHALAICIQCLCWYFILFTAGEQASVTHWVWGWMDSRCCLNVVAKRRISSTAGKRNPVLQRTVSDVTEWRTNELHKWPGGTWFEVWSDEGNSDWGFFFSQSVDVETGFICKEKLLQPSAIYLHIHRSRIFIYKIYILSQLIIKDNFYNQINVVK